MEQNGSDAKVPRRQQYSSCDECRRARVGCDAGRRPSDALQGSKSCTRCLNRQKRCTFDWMRDVRTSNNTRANHKTAGKGNRGRKASLSNTRAVVQLDGSSTTAADAISSTNGLFPESSPKHGSVSPGTVSSEGSLNPLEDRWLRSLYSETWEMVFGNWLSKYSCPFVFGDDSISETFVSISALCTRLDEWMAGDSPTTSSPRTYIGFGSGHVPGFGEITSDNEKDVQIQNSLDRVIRAYAARWLPLMPPAAGHLSYQGTIARLWREARQDMLKVINRPSYRSMLTLYLFGLTPIPEGISDDEELDGLSGHACVQAALQQLYTLRVRQKSLQFNGSKVAPTITARPFSLSPDAATTSSFINAESIAHWAALTFDTSASLTLSCRPILSSGLFGFESDWCWSLVRSCTELFQGMSKDWHVSSYDMTEPRANQIVAAGAAFKLLMWKLSAVFREALRDGHDESALERVYSALLSGIETFNSTYRDLLGLCQKRIHFLSQETKLRWYELVLHYNLSILLAVDAIEATQRFDLLPRLSQARVEAESSVINALVFGVDTTYTITVRSGTSPDAEKLSNTRITAALLAIDPYPHHVVACVQLVRRAIQRDLAADTIKFEAAANLTSILQRALGLLPDSSKSVQAARKQMRMQELGTQTASTS